MSSTFLPCFCHRGPRYRGNQSPTANVVPDRAKCYPSSSCSLSGPRRGCPGLPQLCAIRERQTGKRSASLPNATQTQNSSFENRVGPIVLCRWFELPGGAPRGGVLQPHHLSCPPATVPLIGPETGQKERRPRGSPGQLAPVCRCSQLTGSCSLAASLTQHQRLQRSGGFSVKNAFSGGAAALSSGTWSRSFH